jgi:hypothetical protein
MAGIFGLLMSGAGVIKDQYFNLTSLLLPGNGTNGAQNNTFLDSGTANSGSGFTITRNGNTTQGTFSPFSQTGWGNYFNGSSSILETSTSIFGTWSTANASTTTATIEAMVYVNALQSAPANAYLNPSIIAKGNTYLNFSVNSTGNIVLFHYDGSFRYITSSGTIQANTWNYVAVTITGGTATIYINGTSSGSGTWYGIQTGGLVAPTYIGQTPTGQYWNGYISNLRVSSTVRTIATPLVPYTNDGNTSLLTCQSNRFRDASTNGYTITASGSPSVTPFSPFAPTSSYSAAAVGGSGYFDGSGDYLSIADNAAFDFGSGAFTVEAWFYRTGGGNRTGQTVYSQSASGASSNSALFFGAGNDGVSLYLSTSGSAWTNNIETGVAPTLNAWSHVVWQRNGNTLEIYLNGALQTVVSGSAAFSGTIFNSSRDVEIGIQQSTQGPLFGNLCNLRVVKGATVYTGNFTPPTKPLAASGADSAGSYPSTTNVNTSFASSATSLLLNFTNAGVVDATAKNVLETVGNAQISTTQSKWGGGSMSFDGTGDYLVEPANDLTNFGNGAFTVEGWVRINATGSFQAIYSRTLASTSGYGGTWVRVTDTNVLQGAFSSGTSAHDIIISGTTALTTGQWYHFAWVRSSNTFYLYLNGSQEATTTSSVTMYASGDRVSVGALFVTGSAVNTLNGYVDDLRVTKGLARYTGSTYTVPTAPFPVQ